MIMTNFFKSFLDDFILEIGYISDVDLATIESVVDFISNQLTGGKVIVLGLGKSGIIGRKLAATLSSTGTPSFFVNAGEAGHGDLGMMASGDIVVALSQSGKGEELLKVIPFVKEKKIPLISITESLESPLASQSDFVIRSFVSKEGCPLNVAPMFSTSKTLLIADMMASGLILKKGVSIVDFARTHPFGSLGRKLSVKARDICYFSEKFIVRRESRFSDLLTALTAGASGVAVCLDGEKLIGIFTDGDLRRFVQTAGEVNLNLSIEDYLNKDFRSVTGDLLASEALQLMQVGKFNHLPVLESDGRFLGILSYRIFSEKGFI